MSESTHSPLSREDIADIQTARLTIERHLSGFDDADLPRAAARLRAVLERHNHPAVTPATDNAGADATVNGGQS